MTALLVKIHNCKWQSCARNGTSGLI